MDLAKNVLILVNHDIVIYNFRKELVKHLLDKNYTVYLSSPYGERIEHLKTMGCHIIETNIDRHGTNPINDFKLLLFYFKIIRKIRPQVILTYTIKPNLYGGICSYFCKTPQIANITGLGIAIEKENMLRKLISFLYKYALNHTSCIFAQNQENYNFLKRMGLKESRLKLLPGSGVNLDEFYVLDYPEEDLKTINFLFIGRIMKNKGIEEYLTAAKIIHEKFPYTEFHIIGFCEENYKTVLEEYEADGLIYYHGMQMDIHPFLAKAHCTIAPSYHEGMANVLLESAASARPILASNIPGCQEIFDEGISGLGFSPKSSEELIQAIVKFLLLSYQEKKQMGLAARIKVEQEFNRNFVINEYLNEIKSCMEEKNNVTV